jgi:hypothetical protein
MIQVDEAAFCRLWKLDSQDRPGRAALIADGHHRYETAVAYQQNPAERTLAVLVSSTTGPQSSRPIASCRRWGRSYGFMTSVWDTEFLRCTGPTLLPARDRRGGSTSRHRAVRVEGVELPPTPRRR